MVESSVANSALPLVSSGNLGGIGEFAPLVVSDIPRWLKLRSPMPNVFTASSFSSTGNSELPFSPKDSTTGLSGSLVSWEALLCFPPGAAVVILLPKVVAAFCAAENTDEKKLPPWFEGFGLEDPFSWRGASGADVIFDSLLGPNTADPDRILRCDIMFPDGDLMTLGFAIGSDAPRSLWLAGEKSTVSGSVGVGGVFTINGAGSPGAAGGGVRGALVLIGSGVLAVRGLSGEDVAESPASC